MAAETVTELGLADTMPVTTGRSEQVAIRLPHDHIERTRAVREALTRHGLEPPSMSEVMRAIFAKGLEAWEGELGLAARESKPKTRAKR
jgi:hypothetical protein